MIVALAGRRIDSAEAKEPRFPVSNIETVRTRVRAVLQEKGATALVSSAACGADLIALSEAGQLGLRRRVILPTERRRFRETSVTDRPGEWGALYDQILDAVEAAGDLVVLQNRPDDDAYSAANCAILDEALALAKKHGVSAVDDACATALELRIYEYRFIRRYLERQPQLTLRQVDPLIRELTAYRDLINLKIQEQQP